MSRSEFRTGARALVAALSLGLAACGSDDEGSSVRADAIQQYSRIVHASYEDSLELAIELDDRIRDLVDTPTSASLIEAQTAWLNSREPYLQTEVYRFYDGPIDNPDDGPEGLLNAWPLDEAYIDYVEDDPSSGIINDPSVAISADSLEGLNQLGTEEDVATGYHAVEFLLWGQDLNAASAGNRPATDYVTGGEGTHENQDRRGDYLITVSEMLVGHLEGLIEAWAPDERGNYRADFETESSNEALRRVFTGMIKLSGFETGGERLQTALDSGSPEDEHSCFSDNTNRDMVGDIIGIENVWLGRYFRLDGSEVEGTGLREVVAAEDADLADTVGQEIEESLALAEALEDPFEREIAMDNEDGRERVQALIVSLHALESSLEDVFRLLDLPAPEPE